MKGIKKMMGLVLLIMISACSPEANEEELQNIDVEVSNFRHSQTQYIVLGLEIEYAQDISEVQKNEIRQWIAQDAVFFDWNPIEGSAKDRWDIGINPDCVNASGGSCSQLIKTCPDLEKIKRVEVDGQLVANCQDVGGIEFNDFVRQ